jgi:Carboxypeptidase regulatory-like domain
LSRPGHALLGTLLVGLLLLPAAAYANGSISGTVTEAGTSIGIPEVEVCVYEAGAEPSEPGGGNCVATDQSGHYGFGDLASGSYKLGFFPEPNSIYVWEYSGGARDWSAAGVVAVTDGGASEANAALLVGAQVSGNVTDALTHEPIGGIEVCARDPGDATSWGCRTSSEGGHYLIRGLPGGTYVVEFHSYGEPGYATQYYDGKAEPAEATPLTLEPGAILEGIDARLLPVGYTPPPGGTASSGAASVPTVPTGLSAVTPATEAPRPRRCRKGMRKRRIDGKLRCVKVHRRHGR